MGQMLIDLLFSNSDGLREFPGAHFSLAQEFNHLLTNRLHQIGFLCLLKDSPEQRGHNIFKGLIPPHGEDNPFYCVARLPRFEHGTCGLEVRCSIQLSYRRIPFPTQRAGIVGVSILFHRRLFVHMVSPLTTSPYLVGSMPHPPELMVLSRGFF